MVALAFPNLATGLWALLAPRSWYEDFPGWAPRLVAAYPPYNKHLATDAGAGLLAVGAAAAIGAWWGQRAVVAATMAVFVAFALPHALYHVINPTDLLSGGENTVNAATLIGAAAGALVVLGRAVVGPYRAVMAT